MQAQTQFADSELIITPKGTIYHLDIAPEHLADTVITVGDPGRVSEVSKFFDRIEYKSAHREFITHTGYLGSKRLSVISTGIGTDNIDIVMNELDALTNIDFKTRTANSTLKSLSIIRLGTCGALQKEIAPDSMIISAYAIGLDNLMQYYNHKHNTEESYVLGELMPHLGIQANTLSPYIAEGSIRLLRYFDNSYTSGITVTTPGFYAPQGRSLRAKTIYPNLADAMTSFSSRQYRVLNFEMETSALYGLGKLLGHHVASVSTVINNRITKSFSSNMHIAVENMIKKTLETIENL